MKGRLKYIILFLSSFCLNATAKTDSTKIMRNLMVVGGVNYNYIFGNKYIPPKPPPQMQVFHAGYFIKPTWAFHFGALYAFEYKSHINTRIGLMYYQQKSTIISSPDSVKKYIPDTLSASIKEEKIIHNLEIPVLLGYSINRFSLFYRIKLNPLIIMHSDIKYSNGQASRDNRIEYFSHNLFFYSIVLEILIKKSEEFNISTYLAIDRKFNNYGFCNYDFQAGLIFKIK